MTQLPLLPYQQQHTTTRYEPLIKQESPVAFRPKLPGIAGSDPLLTRKAASPSAGHAALHRVALMGLTTGSREQATCQRRSAASLKRSLHWLAYQEEQERAFLECDAFAASPVQCYSNGESSGARVGWKFMREPLIITTDEELKVLTENAFSGVFQRICRGTAALRHLEEEETACRQRDLVEPWEQGCSEMCTFQELLEGKLMIWNSYVEQLEVWRRLISVVREEKSARVSVLSRFVSCRSPLPCRCLLWDLEVLEESAIPLEPAVNLVCLFVSIVIEENDVLQAMLLAERERELLLIKEQHKQARLALDALERIRLDEQERFDTLLGYHAFCMKIANWEREARPSVAETLPHVAENAEENRLKMWSLHRRRLGGQRGSPYFDYFKYLHVVKTLCVERSTRGEIEAYEFIELCYLMYMHETACRRAVAVDEEFARRQLLLDMETWGRHAVASAETASLEQHVQPAQFRHHTHALMMILQKKKAKELQRSEARVALEAVADYEHRRRGEIMLLETKLQTESRLLFYRVCSGGGDRHVAGRWMLQHELWRLTREEERLRKIIETEEDDAIATRATAHEWMLAHNDVASKAMHERAQRDACDHFMVEHAEIRREIEAHWLYERQVLFETKLCVPSPAATPAVGEAASCCSGEAAARVLDIRQVMVSDLGDFLDDDVLVTIFA
ncbi:hypothetical protein DQ04_01201040 [Trypanosoma grayi]|uniref:hypothetical protein n=1 Tax=Trypanosoma grayi TaxID=71804 RepID=UPI0004F4A04C|nr:hypothetical protein DQ04_01201040 [Trypanosoma grayi]KEG13118.1 hypothetical protein DQ04_01201040 [Trypanosoma grayi]